MKFPPSKEGLEYAKAKAAILEGSGWRSTPAGWRHPRLATAWPLLDALRLQQEADDGVQDPTCRALRGEDEATMRRVP